MVSGHPTTPEQNRYFSARGTLGPDYFSRPREGDNLYNASAVALDADTGRLSGIFQFTPHDVHDWDSTQCRPWPTSRSAGAAEDDAVCQPQRLLLTSSIRTNGKMILAKPFVTQTWRRRSARRAGPSDPRQHPNEEGTRTCPIWEVERTFSRRLRSEQPAVFRERAGDLRGVLLWNEPFRQGETVRVGRHEPSARAAELRRAFGRSHPLRAIRKGNSAFPTTSSFAWCSQPTSVLVFVG